MATHAASGSPVDVRAADMYRLRGGCLTELRRFLGFQGAGTSRSTQQRAEAEISPASRSVAQTRKGQAHRGVLTSEALDAL